jgi:hypothetical protein
MGMRTVRVIVLRLGGLPITGATDAATLDERRLFALDECNLNSGTWRFKLHQSIATLFIDDVSTVSLSGAHSQDQTSES